MALKEVGAAWVKEGNKSKYLSATIDLEKVGLGEGKLYLMVFHNDKGDNPKRPDYKISMQVDDDQAKQVNGSFSDDDVPF